MTQALNQMITLVQERHKQTPYTSMIILTLLLTANEITCGRLPHNSGLSRLPQTGFTAQEPDSNNPHHATAQRGLIQSTDSPKPLQQEPPHFNEKTRSMENNNAGRTRREASLSTIDYITALLARYISPDNNTQSVNTPERQQMKPPRVAQRNLGNPKPEADSIETTTWSGNSNVQETPRKQLAKLTPLHPVKSPSSFEYKKNVITPPTITKNNKTNEETMNDNNATTMRSILMTDEEVRMLNPYRMNGWARETPIYKKIANMTIRVFIGQ